jgi:PAS domain S-box-containing protein
MYANKAVCNIFGCENLEDFKAYSGFTFRGMIHPDDYSGVSDSLKKQTSEDHSEHDFVEFRIIRKDGKIRWVNYYRQHLEAEGENSYYIGFFTDNTDMHQQAESDKALHTAVIEALTKGYDSVWLINDIETQQFELYRIDQEMVHLMPAHMAVKLKKFSEAFSFYSNLVYEEDKQQFLDGVSLENIVRNTESKPIYSVPFRRVFEHGVRHYRVEFSKLDLPGGKTGIVTGFRNVDEEVNKELQIQQSLRERSAIIEALTRSYDSVWFIKDMETQLFELFRVDNDTVHLIPTQEAVKLKRYYDAFVFYSKLVLEEDRKRFLEAVKPENIISNTEEKPLYSVPFRRVFDDKIRSYQVEFARMNIGNGNFNIVIGFKNVDDTE